MLNVDIFHQTDITAYRFCYHSISCWSQKNQKDCASNVHGVFAINEPFLVIIGTMHPLKATWNCIMMNNTCNINAFSNDYINILDPISQSFIIVQL